jgi:hypothetical protein
MARGANPLDEHRSRVAHPRRPGIGHQRYRLALVQQLHDAIGCARLVMLVQREQPSRNPEVRKEPARDARILRRDRVHALQDLERPQRDIAQVSYGSGHHI